jgi:uncharacterized protein (TIGR00251 family)
MAPSWQVALHTEGEDAILIDLFVEPGSSNPGPAGFDQWRKRIHLRVASQARGGLANREVVEQMAELLGVRNADVSIKTGAGSRRKTLRAEGISLDNAILTLSAVLGEEEEGGT